MALSTNSLGAKMTRRLNCTPEQLIDEAYSFHYKITSYKMRFGQYIWNNYGIVGTGAWPELFYEEDIYKALYLALKNIIEN